MARETNRKHRDCLKKLDDIERRLRELESKISEQNTNIEKIKDMMEYHSVSAPCDGDLHSARCRHYINRAYHKTRYARKPNSRVRMWKS